MIPLLVLLSALAASTPEEEALRALFAGRPQVAVRTLEAAAQEDPLLRWIAGRVALFANDMSAARRLFDGGRPADRWGLVEVLLAEGEESEAAGLALLEMDEALVGTHRNALALMLLEQAAARAEHDPGSAGHMLRAVLQLEASEELRLRAEDSLFVLVDPTAGWVDDTLRRAALSRLESTGDDEAANIGARLVAGAALRAVDPMKAFSHFRAVTRHGDPALALKAARAVVLIPVPPPSILSLLEELGARLEGDEELATLRLEHATRLAIQDEAAGSAALLALVGDPVVGIDAAERLARATTDSIRRRELWLALADREGASARGEMARAEAKRDLVRALEETPEGDPRRAMARAALSVPDGADQPSFLFAALPEDEGRLEGLWDISRRFPGGGPWCVELASTLVERGADRETAERYASTCPGSETKEQEALLVHGSDEDEVFLSLLPKGGALEVLVAGAERLLVAENPVDPEILFRASEGNPLHTSLDAFLVAPQRAFEIPLDRSELLRPHRLEARSRGLLYAVTVRAGDRRATALLPSSLLEVQALRFGRTLALAVLDEGIPVADARILVLDGSGKGHEARTDRGGLAILQGIDGKARIMARNRAGLGFAEVEHRGRDEAPPDQVSLILQDRAFPSEGARSTVRAFVTKWGGGEGSGSVTFRSLSPAGELLEEAAGELVNGTASAELLIQGGGRVVALRDERTFAGENVPVQRGSFPLSVDFSPALPRAGESVTVLIGSRETLPPDGLEATVQITTAWRSDTHEVVLEEGRPARFEIGLTNAHPGSQVHVHVRLGATGGQGAGASAHAAVSLVGPTAPSPVEVKTTVQVGSSLGRASGWRIARLPGRTDEIWAAPGDELVLPSRLAAVDGYLTSAAGVWTVSSWVDGEESEAISLVALEPGSLDPATHAWNGASPLLSASIAGDSRIVRLVNPGERVGPPDDKSHLCMAHVAEVEPLPGATCPFLAPAQRIEPELTVEGTLTRGQPAALGLGSSLPAGTLLWAVLRDASDHRQPAGDIPMQDLTPAPLGAASRFWAAESVLGEEMDAALLAEEDRLAEQGPMQRVSLDFATAGSERASVGYGGLGLSGYGRGGGGIGVHTGRAQVHGGTTIPSAPFPASPRALAVLDGAGPGSWEVAAPLWVSAAEIDLVARLPDGTWLRQVRRVPVEGPLPGPFPKPESPIFPQTWDGELSSLREIALHLPIDARVHALAALVKAGDAGASPPLRASLGLSSTGPGRSLAAFLGHGSKPNPSSPLARLEHLADPQRVERAVAALEAAAGAPELAASAAGRILREPALPPWVRARAALALLVAGREQEALAALVGDDELIIAARTIAGRPLQPSAAPGLYALARSEAAGANDRALAIHALSTFFGRPITASAPTLEAASLDLKVMPPVAALRGQEFRRGSIIAPRSAAQPALAAVDRVPAGRVVEVLTRVAPLPTPSKVGCPSDGPWRSRQKWVELPASSSPRDVACQVIAAQPGAATLRLDWYGPEGRLMASGLAELYVEAPRPSSPTDPMSLDERYGLGVAMAQRGLPGAKELLLPLLAVDSLASHAVVGVSTALLADAKKHGEPAELVFAFEAARERSSQGTLDLSTAAAVAHAYSKTGEHKRAVLATRAVLEARFREELGAVRAVQESGLPFSALALLQELMARYPEVPTVASARYLAPSMLLERASGEGDRLGYTRSSLRHTAAAELARFLLLHPDVESAPEGAVLLAETLRLLRDPVRERAMSTPLVEKYGSTPAGWRLSVADARARFATGDLRGAARVLDAVSVEGAAASALALERGRIAEAQGRREDALSLYSESHAEEAGQRAAWLERADLDPPEVITLRSGDRRTVDAAILPGTPVEVSATRIVLEHLLLRDGGQVEPSLAVVDGLAAERTTTLRADSSGHLPLPRLNPGAWLVTTTLEGQTGRFLVLRSDLHLDVRAGDQDGALVHLRDHRGRAVQGASLWAFPGGEAVTATTDSLGAAWLPGAFGGTVLARLDQEYALWSPPEDYGYGGHGTGRSGNRRPSPAPSSHPSRSYQFDSDDIDGMLEKNVAEYNQLFQQERSQTISVQGL